MRHRPDEADLVHDAGQPRQVLADPDAGHPCGNGPEVTADQVGGVRFHVPQVDPARPAEQEYQDTGVAPMPAGRCGRPEPGEARRRQAGSRKEVSAGRWAKSGSGPHDRSPGGVGPLVPPRAVAHVVPDPPRCPIESKSFRARRRVVAWGWGQTGLHGLGGLVVELLWGEESRPGPADAPEAGRHPDQAGFSFPLAARVGHPADPAAVPHAAWMTARGCAGPGPSAGTGPTRPRGPRMCFCSRSSSLGQQFPEYVEQAMGPFA